MKLRQVLIVVAVIATIAVNVLAVTLPLNGRNTADISDSFKVLFVPAGWVFSIWGVIYLGLLAFAVYQALPAQRADRRLEGISGLFLASCVLNAGWLFCWHYGQFPLSLAVMLGLLASLVAIYLRLEIGRRSVSRAEIWSVNALFGTYLGWISVATIANAEDVLWGLGYQEGAPIGPVAWAVLMVVAASGLGILMTLLRREIAYPLVIAWALAGVMAKQAATPAVSTAAGLAAIVVIGVLTFSLARRGRGSQGVRAAGRA